MHDAGICRLNDAQRWGVGDSDRSHRDVPESKESHVLESQRAEGLDSHRGIGDCPIEEETESYISRAFQGLMISFGMKKCIQKSLVLSALMRATVACEEYSVQLSDSGNDG